MLGSLDFGPQLSLTKWFVDLVLELFFLRGESPLAGVGETEAQCL